MQSVIRIGLKLLPGVRERLRYRIPMRTSGKQHGRQEQSVQVLFHGIRHVNTVPKIINRGHICKYYRFEMPVIHRVGSV